MGWVRQKQKEKNLEIFVEIEEIWDEFDRRSKDFEDWEKQEGLEGLVTGMDVGLKKITSLRHHEHFNLMPPEILAHMLTTFVTGVRVGNALAKKRDKGEY